MANLSKQSDHERQRNQRLEEKSCRHENAEPTDGILAEEALERVVVWSKKVEQ
jgi:hypothetical protein